MIEKFINIFNKHKSELKQHLAKQHIKEYKDIVTIVIDFLAKHDSECETLDPTRIHEIDDGNHRGILLYIIPCNDYNPSHYWSVKINYGSCSATDTLRSIHDESEDNSIPNKQQIEDYMILSLHIVQSLKEV